MCPVLTCTCPVRDAALLGCRQPARYASVCRHWNSILANSSEVWKRCVLSASPDQQNAVLADTGAMLRWLLPRRTCIKFITFRNFTVRLARRRAPSCGGRGPAYALICDVM